MIIDESKARKRNWMLDVAVLGIVCTEYCSTMLDKCKDNYSQYLGKIVFATSHHHHQNIARYFVQGYIMLIKRCLNCLKSDIKGNGMFYLRVPTCGVYGDSFSGHHTCLCNSGSLQSWTSCQAVCKNASLWGMWVHLIGLSDFLEVRWRSWNHFLHFVFVC